MDFLTFLLVDERIRIRIREAKKNPDPQHCQKKKYRYILYMIANVANKFSCYNVWTIELINVFAVNTGTGYTSTRGFFRTQI
jgi:hypothetical protein